MKKNIVILFLVILQGIAASPKPKLSFFVELKGPESKALFEDSSLVSQLVQMKASLRIGLQDFSPEMTQTIQKLNKSGIPLIAWLLLPEEEGYWFYMNNGDKAVKRYEDFKKWSAENNLKWEAVGIDLELDFNDAKLLVKHPFRLAWKAYKRLYDNHSLEKGREIYQQLITRIQADSFAVESYVVPMIYDERIAKTTSLQKLMGLIDIQTPQEIPMLYTSVWRNHSVIPSYHQEGQPIALGITGGGVVIEGMQPAWLTWEELSVDLLLANQYSFEIVIFSLEGTVAKGWIPKILSFDFSQKPPDISAILKTQEKSRKKIQNILIILDHPLLLTVGILILISLIIYAMVWVVKIFLKLIKPARN